jgi:hypothetical protein
MNFTTMLFPTRALEIMHGATFPTWPHASSNPGPMTGTVGLDWLRNGLVESKHTCSCAVAAVKYSVIVIVNVVLAAKPLLSRVVIGTGAGFTLGQLMTPDATERLTSPIASVGTPLTAEFTSGDLADAGAEMLARHVVSFVQSASAVGMTAFEAPDGGPVPSLFVAVTLHVYVLPFVKPVTLIGLKGPDAEPAVPPLLDVQRAS